MEITESEYHKANEAACEQRENGYIVSAHYYSRLGNIVVRLSTGEIFFFPAHMVEGLSKASPKELAEIEITPSGLGLHWPRLDVDLYLPAVIRKGKFYMEHLRLLAARTDKRDAKRQSVGRKSAP